MVDKAGERHISTHLSDHRPQLVTATLEDRHLGRGGRCAGQGMSAMRSSTLKSCETSPHATPASTYDQGASE
jgi:hypothetical protein